MSHPDNSPSEHEAADAAFDATLALAREYQPDVSRAEFGFGTRLTAQLADLRCEGIEPGRTIWDEALAWLWGGAAGAAPIVAGLAVWFFIANGLDLRLDGGTNLDSVYHHLSSYLPSFSADGS